MTEQELNSWGTALGWDVIDKIYALVGRSTTWGDYSYPESTNPDNAWDQDAYYEDFDNWWLSLSYEEKLRIYNKL